MAIKSDSRKYVLYCCCCMRNHQHWHFKWDRLSKRCFSSQWFWYQNHLVAWLHVSNSFENIFNFLYSFYTHFKKNEMYSFIYIHFIFFYISNNNSTINANETEFSFIKKRFGSRSYLLSYSRFVIFVGCLRNLIFDCFFQ